MAQVIGHVVATQKYRTLVGMKFSVIQPLDEQFKEVGSPLIALDPESQCGQGEYVYYVASGDAASLEVGKWIPSDATIMGIIDSIDQKQEFKKLPGGFKAYRKD